MRYSYNVHIEDYTCFKTEKQRSKSYRYQFAHKLLQQNRLEELSEYLGIKYLEKLNSKHLCLAKDFDLDLLKNLHMVAVQKSHVERHYVIALTPQQLSKFMTALEDNPSIGSRIFLTPRHVFTKAITQYNQKKLSNHARYNLARHAPSYSSFQPHFSYQKLSFFIMLCSFFYAVLFHPSPSILFINYLFIIIFLAFNLMRLCAIFYHGKQIHQVSSQERDLIMDCLPIYSVMIPLYKEAHMVPMIIQSISQLNYPKDLLDVKLIIEADDQETARAIEMTDLPYYFDVITVSASKPKTKPKALNFALPFCRGEFVVVYDAEDIPEPNQLLDSVYTFSKHPSLSCLQCFLNVKQKHYTWLQAIYAAEYGYLFRGYLPMLSHWKTGFPLGGTSNHFRISVLKSVMAWDPYNVTEDADLGYRLFRLDIHAAVLGSSTDEEAPMHIESWLPQRTRWLKGWMQTWLLLSRQPVRLINEIGGRNYMIFQVAIGGLLLSTLMHPLFLILVFASWLSLTQSADISLLTVLNLTVFITGYYVNFINNLYGLRWSNLQKLWPFLLFIPVYWMLTSIAGYRALWQMAFQPYMWEKTNHIGSLDIPPKDGSFTMKAP